jgi:hypothetical protein
MLKDIQEYVLDTARSFGIISAHEENQSVSTNLDRNVQLARAVESKGFDYVWLDGYWKGQNGSRYEEASLFVIADNGDNEKLFNFLKEQSEAAGQDGFIFRNENDDTVTIECLNGESKKAGKFKPDTLGDIYSRVAKGRNKGRPFVFAAYRPLFRALGSF